ncbi:MAG: 2-phosphosulfolactate phosphatase [Clostridia bacterium]
MDIKILHMMEGAKQAKGLAVIIDVFRAFTVECYLMENGAEKIIPIGDKELAYQLKRENETYILIGERQGIILPGFDYGNSPSQIENIDFTNKVVIHTTSTGTQGIDNAINAEEVITGSLVNAKAIVKYIRKKNFQTISLVSMGAKEDCLCAEYIKAMLENTEIDLNKKINELKVTSGAKFFDKKQNEVFPERDFFLCTEVNKYHFILKLVKEETGLNYIEKINI